MKGGIMIQQDGLYEDIKSFFLLPISKTVWAGWKVFQNDDFVGFVESSQNRT